MDKSLRFGKKQKAPDGPIKRFLRKIMVRKCINPGCERAVDHNDTLCKNCYDRERSERDLKLREEHNSLLGEQNKILSDLLGMFMNSDIREKVPKPKVPNASPLKEKKVKESEKQFIPSIDAGETKNVKENKKSANINISKIANKLKETEE